MSWYYLDTEGSTKGPVTSTFILQKYHYKTGEITEATHVWNTECGVEAWSEISSVYSNVVDDVIHSIKSGLVNKKLLALMMNPYDVYITKQQEIKNNSLPIGKAKVEIEYKGYLANSVENQNESQPEGLKEFIQNREFIQLGIKKNAYGLEMALYKIREGESCNIYIPWRLAYGEKGAGNLIPPKTDILFELKIHRIEQQGASWELIKFDKWAKMKAKWNTSKSQNNMLFNKNNYEIAPKKLPGLPPSKSVPPGPQNPNPVQQAPPNLPIQKTQPPQPTIVSEPNTSVSALLKKQKSNKPKSVTINDEYKKQQSEQSPPKSVGVVGGGGGGVAAKASLFSGGSGGSSDSISIDKEPFRRPLPKGRNKKRASYRKKTEPIPSPATSPKAAPQQQPPPLPPGVGDSQSVPMDASQQQAQPPMAGDFKARQKRTKSVPVPWDQWLKNQQIPDPLISKLAEGGIASWDELHAIEDDVDEVAKELSLTTLHKIKLKALLRKLPSMEELPQTEVIEPDPEPVAVPPPVPVHVVEEVKQVEPEPEPPKEPTPEPDYDDPRYLKTQIELLKVENIKLTKIADENGTKQQIMESWDTLYTKDVELKSLKDKLDVEQKKNEQQKLEIMKLEKQIQVKDNQNYIDIQEKMYQNYCKEVNGLIEKLQKSDSTLDKVALNAIEEIKKKMNNNGNILEKELKEKKNKLNENRTNVKQLKQQKMKVKDDMKVMINANEIVLDKNDTLLSRIDNVDDLIKKRKSIQVTLNTKVNGLISSINVEQCKIFEKIGNLCNNKYNQLFYKYFIEKMTMNFYDSKMIKSQFIQNNNSVVLFGSNNDDNKEIEGKDSVLCKDAEKIIFDIPLTYKLLNIIRNEELEEMNLVYDVLCLDKFTKNMLLFENNIIYNDPLTFSSLIAISLTQSKTVQNIIKQSKQSSLYNNGSKAVPNNNAQNIDDKIVNNLKERAEIFVNNLTFLIVTGYALLIVNTIQNQNKQTMNYIDILSNLCLSHPVSASKDDNSAPKQLKAAVNKENLNKVLKCIELNELKEIINDYYNNFGKNEFIKKVINTARGSKFES